MSPIRLVTAANVVLFPCQRCLMSMGLYFCHDESGVRCCPAILKCSQRNTSMSITKHLGYISCYLLNLFRTPVYAHCVRINHKTLEVRYREVCGHLGKDGDDEGDWQDARIIDRKSFADGRSDIKNGKGGIDALYINEVSRPTPTHTQALVKVKAFGLNRMDLLQREGMYPVPPQAPKILGVEFSGTIEELAGESERGFKKGDAVFGLAYGGAYAEYIAVSTHMLVHKPDELSWEECAGIPEVSPSTHDLGWRLD